MKLLLFFVLLGSSLCSFAGETLIHEKQSYKYDEWSLFRTQYRVNPTLGRAWVELELVEQDLTDDGDWETVRVKVPGMYLDSSTGDIVMNNTVCATTDMRSNKIMIYPTGDCEFNQVKDKVQVDDGFNLKTKRRLRVYLNTQN